MESRNEEAPMPNEPTQVQEPEGRKPRFQIIKVEDSVAEGQGGQGVMHPTRHCRCRCGR